MDKHWNAKIAGLEGLRDVVQMHPDLFFARSVFSGVGRCLNGAAVFTQQKVAAPKNAFNLYNQSLSHQWIFLVMIF